MSNDTENLSKTARSSRSSVTCLWEDCGEAPIAGSLYCAEHYHRKFAEEMRRHRPEAFKNYEARKLKRS